MENYPIVVFSHAYYGFRNNNTAYCRSWAARGFVVFAMEHRQKSTVFLFHHILCRDGSSVVTHTLERQENGMLKRTVLDTRHLSVMRDLDIGNPEFDSLVCALSINGLNFFAIGSSTRKRVH